MIRASVPRVFVGCGTCGLGAGASKVLKAVHDFLAQSGRPAKVVEVGCIGLCSAEPLLDVELPGRTRVSFQKVTPQLVPLILERVFANDPPQEHALFQMRGAGAVPWGGIPWFDQHPFFAPQTRWVLENCGLLDPTSLAEYVERGGFEALDHALRTFTPMELCDLVERSGLRGRGGGGFPAGKKWKFALNTPSERKFLICNADEGDPGAFMDRAVIEGDPYKLVEGMAIAAYAIGAAKAYVYIRAEYPLAIQRLEVALREAREAGWIGKDIQGTGFDLEIVIKKGAGAFVCGEETALIHSVEGRRGMPRPRPPFPAVSGLHGSPTIINNVETLANLPGLVQRGADAFAALGTASSKGTKVFAVSGKIARTGLVEVAMGTPLRDVLYAIGGGIPGGKAFKAVQIGGPSGGCVPEEHVDIPIDYESLKTVGAMMGSGGLVVMDEDTCMVDVAKFFMEFIQRESCGKCIPCREGTKQMLDILQRITRSQRLEERLEALERFQGVMALEELAGVITDTSLCGLGQTAPNPVLSTLRWFRDEYEAHVYERRCPAGACRELLHYRIDPKLCKGCRVCARQCPADAILGSAREAHVIDPEKCIACGACRDVCRLDAVLVQ